MQLTDYTDYTLRTLMYLAVNADRHATIAEIARTFRISETHLNKIVHQLGIVGDIQTIRGRNGGIRLGRSADSINLGSVVRRTESDMKLVACFKDAESCVIADGCALRTALHEALGAFLSVLDRYTLADLVAPRRKLAALLGIALPLSTGNHPTAAGVLG